LFHNAPDIKVTGWMIGNGVTNWKYDTTPATIEAAYHHAMYSQELYDTLQASGCNWTVANFGPTEKCDDLAS
jgi:hypothetical protein